MKKTLTLILVAVSTFSFAQDNVGVGTAYPNNGKLVIKNSSSISGLVVGDSTTGISFAELNLPTINFNTYYRSGRKHMDDGFASYFFFNPTNGYLYYNSAAAAGTQGTAPTITNRLAIDNNGNLGINVTGPPAGIHVRGKSLLVDNTSGFGDVTLTANTSTTGGLVELRNNTNIRTVAMRAGDGSGISGELIFYDNSGTTSTLELDGDYAATGRSRIIVDELQIKGGADFAEYFDVKAIEDGKVEAGMLVSIDENEEGKMAVSNKAYDRRVAGVISGANGIKPGMMMGHKGTVADGKYPVAISGRVYVKAQAFKSAIQPGDLITTSAEPGVAMKVTSNKKATGSIIGKAMGTLEAGKSGYLLVLLNIQ